MFNCCYDRAKLSALHLALSRAIHDHARDDSEAQDFFISATNEIEELIMKAGGHIPKKEQLGGIIS